MATAHDGQKGNNSPINAGLGKNISLNRARRRKKTPEGPIPASFKHSTQTIDLAPEDTCARQAHILSRAEQKHTPPAADKKPYRERPSQERLMVQLRAHERPEVERAKQAYMAEHNLARLSNPDYVRRLMHTPSVELHSPEDIALFDQLCIEMSPGVAKLTRAHCLSRMLEVFRDAMIDDPLCRRKAASAEFLAGGLPDEVLYAEVRRRERRVVRTGVSSVQQTLSSGKRTLPKSRVKPPPVRGGANPVWLNKKRKKNP